MQACARRALEMQADEEGFLYPARSAGKCVRCGLCHAICPAAGGTHQENGTFDGAAYLCTSVDRSFARKSATAGICTRLSLDCVGRSGKVFGVVLDETDWKARHVCAGDEETVERMRNSKYLQSDTRDTYSEAKSLLKAGEEVLYVGTPCQIAGLKAFLGRPHERLLTVDLVCHGVFSPKLVPLEVSYWENLFKGKVSDLRFRSKRAFPWYMGGVVNFDVTDSRGKTRHVERHAKSSPTYRCFAYSGDGVSYNLRPSCYSCPFRGKGRYGDLTVGDAWGLYERYRKFYPPHAARDGISVLLCNTPKGISAGMRLKPHYKFVGIPVDASFAQPALLPADRDVPGRRKAIYENTETPYGQLVERLFQVDLEHEDKVARWNYMKRRIKSAARRMLFPV